MKFNQWTLALAAVGAVSLVSAARADEAKISQVQTALASTTLSGYVDTAVQYNPGNVGTGGYIAPGVATTKIDSFSLNDVDIALDHPEDESPWAAGYHVELNYGTDAVGLGTGSVGYSASLANVRQAYITLRTPIGNGIDWKVGIQDNIIGYEGNTDYANPNYTRSYGYDLEPTTLLGLIGTYKVCNALTIEAGIVDDNTAFGTPYASTSAKNFVAAVALTAPDSWGWIKGATLNAGANVQFTGDGKGAGSFYPDSQVNYFAGVTLPTPWTPLKLGAAFDLVTYADKGLEQTYPYNYNAQDDDAWVAGVYANFQATDKLAFNARAEYLKNDTGYIDYTDPLITAGNQSEEITATVQYNLWANVTSRAEFRWDHASHGDSYGADGSEANTYLLALNLIYQF